MKLSGVEFKRYYADKAWWPEGQWHEDEVVSIDGVDVPEGEVDLSLIADTCVIEIQGGSICVPLGQETSFSKMSMEAHMRAWHRKQTVRNLLVQVDASKLDAVMAAIKAAGGRVAA